MAGAPRAAARRQNESITDVRGALRTSGEAMTHTVWLMERVCTELLVASSFAHCGSFSPHLGQPCTRAHTHTQLFEEKEGVLKEAKVRVCRRVAVLLRQKEV